jgi:uncharacterized protein YggL (DUF469 family)
MKCIFLQVRLAVLVNFRKHAARCAKLIDTPQKTDCGYNVAQTHIGAFIMSKRRSPRLLKKLKLGEFKELGFAFSADFTKELEMEDQEQLVIRLLDDVIEKRKLALGGWIDGGFVTKWKNGSTTEDDKKAVEEWLKSNKALKNVAVGELVDAWYE